MPDSFDLGEPPQPAKPEAYRVLARKYRPQTFSQLIGQDAMVRTLGNAIARGRLAHAFLMTGVRGVGKTSTARLIAKALNCEGPDGQGGPTIDPCGVCDPCRAIAEGRHVDVIEIDAASHNGIDDVRQMTDAVRYSAVSARYKMYIIDEVHMMSKPAFNALLKTLEEPPAHVKFLLATTEVEKVPVTVLSRCQRFDLRRIPAEALAKHFADVCGREGVAADADALMLIARAAEGSARDGLSILDQAIAHGGLEGGAVKVEAVRDMLGLSDRGAVRDLLGAILGGDAPTALAALRRQYDHGVDPASVLRGLLETVHGVTLAKVGAAADAAQPAEERAAMEGWAAALSFPALHRLWQLLLKGHDEVARAALPIEAAEMALLRCIHASTLPDPGDLARKLASGTMAAAASPPPQTTASAPSPEPVATDAPADFAALVALLRDSKQPLAAERLHNGASVVRYAPPHLVLSGARPFSSDSIRDIAGALKDVTGQLWRVSIADESGAPTLREAAKAADEAERQAVWNSPMVQAARAAFPDAQLESWTSKRSTM